MRVADAMRGGGGTRVSLDDVLPLLSVVIEADDHELIMAVDRGEPQAQCELALLFMEQDLFPEAQPWLEMSARGHCPEAMLWLGRCRIAGLGVGVDVPAGEAWIGKAARLGHVMAGHLTHYLNDPARPALGPMALDEALDHVELAVVVKALASASTS